MKPQANSHGGGWEKPCFCTCEVSPPNLLPTGLSREQVIWLRSAAPGPGWKNSLREAIVLCEQQEIPFQKATKLRQ